MTPFELPSEPNVGERARRLRNELGHSTAQVAEQAGVGEIAVATFELTGECSVQAMFAIHRALSGEEDLSSLFTLPKFRTLDDAIHKGVRDEGEPAAAEIDPNSSTITIAIHRLLGKVIRLRKMDRAHPRLKDLYARIDELAKIRMNLKAP